MKPRVNRNCISDLESKKREVKMTVYDGLGYHEDGSGEWLLTTNLMLKKLQMRSV